MAMQQIPKNLSGDDAARPLDMFDAATNSQADVTGSVSTSGLSAWEANELTVGSLILAYGLLVIAISAWLMIKGKDAEAVLRMVAVISAVIMASFLLIVGYDSQQMNPVIGLLGTIVGYLLGKDQGYQAGTRDEAIKGIIRSETK
jgi:hypothetical protein